MTIIDQLVSLVGNYQATYRLWMSPEQAPLESLSSAVVSPMVNGKFVCIEYTWSVAGNLVEGELLIGYETEPRRVTLVWLDAWHNGERFMVCQGEASPDGVISVLGSYPAPDGPDWGWRTMIEPVEDGFSLRMYNILPGGAELLAVEAAYTRGELP